MTTPTLTISDIVTNLDNKTYSAQELTQDLLSNIKASQHDLNAFITITEDEALTSAKAADERRAKGEPLSPIDGVPIAQKDIFCTQGVKTSCGSKMLDNFIAPYDATVVQKCNNSGLVNLGKTNMDEFAMGSSNETSFYGACKNPWDLERVPGGSSGGSAAAVAARLVPAATATDTGGSIRQPAALCGVTGIKPTYGQASRWGMIAYASSLDQAGWIAQDAKDCATLLEVITGHDTKDSTSSPKATNNFTSTLDHSLKGKVIGLAKEYLDQMPAEVATHFENTKAMFEKLGVTFKEVSLPHAHLATAVYYIVAPAECSSNLSRYDGARFGYRCSAPEDLEDMYVRSRTQAFGDEVKRRILVGTYALSSGYFDAYYIKAQKARRLIQQDFINAFTEVDAILTPTSPSPAFKCGEKTSDPVQMYLSDIYTLAVNLAGLPALSMPAGFSNGLPIGMQLISKHFNEQGILNFAHQFQQETDFHIQVPSYNTLKTNTLKTNTLKTKAL